MEWLSFLTHMRLEWALSLIFLLALVLELLAGRWQNKKIFHLRSSLNNLLIGAISFAVISAITLLQVPLLQWLYDHARITNGLAEPGLRFALLFLLTDFIEYWFHRLSHEVNLFWTAHVVHHQDRQFNLTVGLRTSFLVPVFNLFFYLPLPLAGFQTGEILLVILLQGFWQLLLHTSLVKRMGFLEFILVTPSAHRVHHGKNEPYIDRNYGKVFLFWDLLFGTYRKESEPVVFGITHPQQRTGALHSITDPVRDLYRSARKKKGLREKLLVVFGRPADNVHCDENAALNSSPVL